MRDTQSIQFLQEFYFANWTSIRHLEEQRAHFTNISIAVLGAVLTGFAIGWPDAAEADRNWLLLGVSVSFLMVGVLGISVLAKTYERIDFLMSGMQKTAKRLDAHLPDLELETLQTQNLTEHQARYKYLSRVKYAAAWSWIFRIVFLLGILGIGLSVFRLVH